MEIDFTNVALDHLNYFKKINNTVVLKKVKQLLESIKSNPYVGVGKPEPLKYQYSGYWSRRINKEHRLVYKFFEEENRTEIYSLKGHY